MNKKIKIIAFFIALNCFFSCKKGENYDVAEESVNSDVITSSAAKTSKDSDRKFIRTATLKFRTKNVVESTFAIENITNKFGGFVTYTNLESVIQDSEKAKISNDSTLETIRFTVENNMIVRVPNTQLDTVLRCIAKEIDFLDSRLIKADDVSLQILGNKVSKKRIENTEKQIEKSIDAQDERKKSVLENEQYLESKKQEKDSLQIKTLSIKDKINFSTININLYQIENIRQELIKNQKSTNFYKPNLFFRIGESLKNGWYLLEEIINIFFSLWPIILLSLGGFIWYKKTKK